MGEITQNHINDFLGGQDISICEPGTFEWQEYGCWTAYKNFTNPSGCVMAEDKNPMTAICELYRKLNFHSTDAKESVRAEENLQETIRNAQKELEALKKKK